MQHNRPAVNRILHKIGVLLKIALKNMDKQYQEISINVQQTAKNPPIQVRG